MIPPSGTAAAPPDRLPQSNMWIGVLIAGFMIVVLGVVALLGVTVYFVVMDPRYFLEKAWNVFFAGASAVVALGGFFVARALRMRGDQARHS